MVKKRGVSKKRHISKNIKVPNDYKVSKVSNEGLVKFPIHKTIFSLLVTTVVVASLLLITLSYTNNLGLIGLSPPTEELRAFYTMDNRSDSSGNVNDLDCGKSGSCPNRITTGGKIDRAYKFNGSVYFQNLTDLYLLTPTIPNSERFTIAAWVKVNPGTIGRQSVIEYTNKSNVRKGIAIAGDTESGKPIIYYGNRLAASGDVFDLRDSKWHHIVVRYDGTSPSIYVDNVSVDINLLAGTSANGIGPAMLRVGNSLSQGESFFNGTIDEIRIHTRALSENKINDIYNYMLPTSCTPDCIGKPAGSPNGCGGVCSGGASLQACTDSDSGKTYSTLGTTVNKSSDGTPDNSSTDYCLSSTVLKEFYCTGFNVLVESHTCPNGCESGVCTGTTTCTPNAKECLTTTSHKICSADGSSWGLSINCGTGETCNVANGECVGTSPTITCTDSDNGKVYETIGTTINKSNDVALNTSTDFCTLNTLTEFYCSPLKAVLAETIACPNTCVNGACQGAACTTNAQCGTFNTSLVCDTIGGINGIYIRNITPTCDSNNCNNASHTTNSLKTQCASGSCNPATLQCNPISSPTSCIDTDSGIAGLGASALGFYTIGSISYLDENDDPATANDECTGSVLTEYICDIDGFDYYIDYTCPNGCSGGKCLGTPTESCSDSDSGKKYNVSGSVDYTLNDDDYLDIFDDLTIDLEDICYTGSQLIEFYCVGNNYPNATLYNCPSGTICSSGKCVNYVTPPGPTECTTGAERCTGTNSKVYSECISGHWFDVGNINGKCGYSDIIDIVPPPIECSNDDDCNTGEKCSSNSCVAIKEPINTIWIVLIVILVIAILGVVGYLIYFYIQKKNKGLSAPTPQRTFGPGSPPNQGNLRPPGPPGFGPSGYPQGRPQGPPQGPPNINPNFRPGFQPR